MIKDARPQINIRNLVLTMLEENEKGQKSHIVLKSTLDKNSNLDKQMRALATRLYEGALERRIELDYVINTFSKTPINKMKPVIRNILRLSVYQLMYMKSVPQSAVCNEAVKLTIKRKLSGLKGFVNGVLRNIAREKDNVSYPVDMMQQLSVKFSMPEWIINLWNENYGMEKTVFMLNAMYKERATTVRCNTSKASVNEIILKLQGSKVNVKESVLYKNALNISGYDSINSLDVFRNGMITVQDLSSMMAGIAANPKMNDYIIDVCAAPGGKSLHMAELMNKTGTVEARDLTEYKIKLIEENVRRTGYKNIVTKVMDATVPDKESVEKADIVMADLPCSGLGVLSKKSDIKYNISFEQIEELVKLQRKILSVVYRYVKPGGTLIFSTCTVNKLENDENVAWIEKNLPLKLKTLSGILPKQMDGTKGYIQIFPGEYDMDGFFISAFERI